MEDFQGEIDHVLSNEEPIPREKVASWIERASDLATLSKLYRVTGEHYYRIKPELGAELECAVIERHLLECIRQDPKEDEDQAVFGRWEAAEILHHWFCHLNEMGDSSAFLRHAARSITELYLASNEGIRDAIEMGFLEHALEQEDLRTYFADWSANDTLRPAWERALEWGKAHPGQMWNMIQELKKLKDRSPDDEKS